MHKYKIIVMAMAFIVGLLAAIVIFQPSASEANTNDSELVLAGADKQNELSTSAVSNHAISSAEASGLDLPSEKEVLVIDYVDEPVPDFTQYTQVKAKKKAFFNYLKPVALAQNEYIKNVRLYVKALQNTNAVGTAFTQEQQQEFNWLTTEYRVDTEQSFYEIFAELLRKIDIIPVELVLAQTANESGWGTSRFAVKGYNFFGLWCFRKGCGFVPSQRDDDAEHEVAKFNDLSSGMYSYMRNLNRHPAYKEMRIIRENYRSSDKPVTAHSMAKGLMSYSERGADYIEELHDMMRINSDLIAP